MLRVRRLLTSIKNTPLSSCRNRRWMQHPSHTCDIKQVNSSDLQLRRSFNAFASQREAKVSTWLTLHKSHKQSKSTNKICQYSVCGLILNYSDQSNSHIIMHIFRPLITTSLMEEQDAKLTCSTVSVWINQSENSARLFLMMSEE